MKKFGIIYGISEIWNQLTENNFLVSIEPLRLFISAVLVGVLAVPPSAAYFAKIPGLGRKTQGESYKEPSIRNV